MTETVTPEVADEELFGNDYIARGHYRIIFAADECGDEMAFVVMHHDFTEADREYVTDLTERRASEAMFIDRFDAASLAWHLSQAEKSLEYHPSGTMLTPYEVSATLGMARGTLAKWRTQGKGPEFVKVGRAVRYNWSDVEAYIKSNRKAAA